jgi:hypothetical protein
MERGGNVIMNDPQSRIWEEVDVAFSRYNPDIFFRD